MALKPLQLTLALIKPDVMAQPHIVGEIREIIRNNGLLFIRSQTLHLSRAGAEGFYKEHDGKFFYNRLVSYMSSGPIAAHVLAHPEAIPFWRRLMGPTKVFRTIHEAPDTIRGRYGLTDTRNCTHGSDSDENARREIGYFFKDFDIDLWYKKEEPYFREGKVNFDSDKVLHIPEGT